MTATNALIEFQDTDALRQRLAAFIEDRAQLPRADAASFATPELIGLGIHNRRQKVDQIVRHLLLLLERNQRPILDLDLHTRLEGLRETITTHTPARHIVAKYARCSPDDILETGHDAADFRARGGRYIEDLGIWIITRNTTPATCHPENDHKEALLP